MNPPLDEIHTGTIWNAACQHYCGNDPNAFPLALVCFYDKTHTDLHGSLACAPFICTPAFLNRDAQNNDSNYMVLGYIPNHGHGKGKAKQRQWVGIGVIATIMLACGIPHGTRVNFIQRWIYYG